MRNREPTKLSLQKTRPINEMLRSNSKQTMSTIKKPAPTNPSCPTTIKERTTRLALQSTGCSLRLFDDQGSNWHSEDFEVIKQLGRGKFGIVFSAREKKSSYIVAIKKMSKEELKRNNFHEQVKRQIQIQSHLRHQNILRLYGFFWDEESIYIILEYAQGGELYKQLKLAGRLPQPRVANIIRQVCTGLEYLHSKNIIHRDIKPENLLISFDKIKIADFGWSIYSRNKRDTLCGTLDYLAPEMVRGQPHDRSIDVWAVGILCYELAVGHPPFETPTYEETYEKICSSDVEYPPFLSFQIQDFLRKMLLKRPADRMTLKQALEHEWIISHQGSL